MTISVAGANTPERVIKMALKDAGLVQEGETPTDEVYSDSLNRLNDLINFEQTQGLKLWLQYDLSIPLVAGQATYTIKSGGDINLTRPSRVLDSGYYLDSNNFRRNIILIDRDTYMLLSNPTGQGAITQYFVDKRLAEMAVTFWLVPDAEAATGTAHVLIQNQAGLVSTISETMQFPPEWFMWLRWALAADLSNGQPDAIMNRCMIFAAGYREALEGWDVEDAPTQFAPDQRVAFQGGSFR